MAENLPRMIHVQLRPKSTPLPRVQGIQRFAASALSTFSTPLPRHALARLGTDHLSITHMNTVEQWQTHGAMPSTSPFHPLAHSPGFSEIVVGERVTRSREYEVSVILFMPEFRIAE